MFSNEGVQDNGFASLSNAGLGALTPLMTMLMREDIVPGSEPGYQLCKEIFVAHPLGAILTDAPITRAQSQERIIKVPGLAESRLIERFWKVWKDMGKEGATLIIHDLMSTSRRYGIASIGVGEIGEDLSALTKPFDIRAAAKVDMFFNILDPLNTAGSLVLNQDPNSPSFLKPEGTVRVQSVNWHPSRLSIKLNERPVYISYTSAAFGFSGRSVYQRALYLLKSYIQTMITDDMITKKAGLLVAKMKSPGAMIDQLMQFVAGVKRGQLKSGIVGQVLGIGIEEEIETLNFTNLEAPYKLARENVLKNIASATGMPASIIAQETLTEGFGEGTEDFKKEVQYLNYIRKDMEPAYAFMDNIVMHKAWTPEFYQTLQDDVSYSSALKGLEFETWFFNSMQAFTAEWPNLNEEPDSEKSKMEDVQMKSAIALAEVMLPELDPVNKARVLVWLSENCNEREALFASKLVLDEDLLETYLEENKDKEEEAMMGEGDPKEPKPFSVAS